MLVLPSIGFFVSLALYNFAQAALTPGAQPRSRWLSAAFLWVLAPVCWLAVLQANAALWGCLLVLVTVIGCIGAVEHGRIKTLLLAVASSGLAWTVHPASGAVSIAVVSASLWWLERRDWHYWSLACGWVFLMAVLWWHYPVSWHPQWWLQPANNWGIPRLIYVWLLPIQPYGCVLLPLLLLIARRTDVQRPIRRVLVLALGASLCAVAGFAQFGAVDLLPPYALLLLLFFPAWDRVISYGFYFLGKKWMGLILGTLVFVQLLAGYFLVYMR